MNAGLLILFCIVPIAILAWPRHGILARWRRSQELAQRSLREDAIKHILKSEANGRIPTHESIAGALQITTNAAADLLSDLEERGLLAFEAGRLRLNPTGRALGLHLVRAHRLWESYLAEQTGVEETEWHSIAERQEHLLTPQDADQLAAQLGHPTRDPHGDVIPNPEGGLIEDAGRSLNSVGPETPVIITHIEDEPETVYRQLVALGLRPGMKAFVIEKSATRIRFWANGNEQVLAPVFAENLSVKPLPELTFQDLVEEEYLSGLRPGTVAQVIGLSPACRGPERRRLWDLGFVSGTPVEVEMVSPAGDPTAYRVRGTVVALRREQASLIRIRSQEGESP